MIFPSVLSSQDATTLKKPAIRRVRECKKILLRMMSRHPVSRLPKRKSTRRTAKQTYKGTHVWHNGGLYPDADQQQKTTGSLSGVAVCPRSKGKEYALTKHWFFTILPATKKRQSPSRASHFFKEEPSVVSLANAVYEILYFFAIKGIFSACPFQDLQNEPGFFTLTK